MLVRLMGNSASRTCPFSKGRSGKAALGERTFKWILKQGHPGVDAGSDGILNLTGCGTQIIDQRGDVEEDKEDIQD